MTAWRATIAGCVFGAAASIFVIAWTLERWLSQAPDYRFDGALIAVASLAFNIAAAVGIQQRNKTVRAKYSDRPLAVTAAATLLLLGVLQALLIATLAAPLVRGDGTGLRTLLFMLPPMSVVIFDLSRSLFWSLSERRRSNGGDRVRRQ